MSNLKVALVYDKVNTWGGAERVLLALHEIFPEAPLFTSVYKDMGWERVFSEIMPSFLQKVPFAKAHSQFLAPLMPVAFESFDFAQDKYDIVISVTSGEAKAVIAGPRTLHVCYCLTPTRYLWSDPGYEKFDFGVLNSVVQLIKEPFLTNLRTWDYCAAQRPDAFSTISNVVKRRIEKYYRREAEVIYPFVDTELFINKSNEQISNTSNKYQNNKNSKIQKFKNYFLVVSRLAGYKRVDLAIRACQELGLNLVVVGEGPERAKLEYRSSEVQKLQNNNTGNATFLGKVGEEKLVELYQNCEALIMPQEEDFGLVALEAQACGRPVIAFGRGGATETVIDGETGLFFERQSVQSLVGTLAEFKKIKFESKKCRQQAEKFSLDKFKLEFKKWVLDEWKKYDKIIR